MTERISPTSGWVSVGNVRVTASEWHLLHMLITTPILQEASNAKLEQLREGKPFSSVATDIDELMSKGLIMVYGSVKEPRTVRPTGRALEAMADV